MRLRWPLFSGSSQLDLQLRDQFTHRFAERAPPVIENGVPIGERILMHLTPLPAPHAGNGRDQVRADASFDFHQLPIPSSFLDDSEAFVFFGGFAFGLRTSLFERFCPLAILSIFNVVFPRSALQTCRARTEVDFQTVKQTSPGAPRLGAPFERGADMRVRGRRCPLTVRQRESAAPVSGILGPSP